MNFTEMLIQHCTVSTSAVTAPGIQWRVSWSREWNDWSCSSWTCLSCWHPSQQPPSTCPNDCLNFQRPSHYNRRTAFT